jgi:hypothetical protein
VWVAPESTAAHAGYLETGWGFASEPVAAESFVDSCPGGTQDTC